MAALAAMIPSSFKTS
jgi:hypothetical protein